MDHRGRPEWCAEYRVTLDVIQGPQRATLRIGNGFAEFQLDRRPSSLITHAARWRMEKGDLPGIPMAGRSRVCGRPAANAVDRGTGPPALGSVARSMRDDDPNSESEFLPEVARNHESR